MSDRRRRGPKPTASDLRYSANREALPASGLATSEQVAAYTAGVPWPLPRNPWDRWQGLAGVIGVVNRAVRDGELYAVIDDEPPALCEHGLQGQGCECPTPVPKRRIRIPVSAAIDWH